MKELQIIEWEMEYGRTNYVTVGFLVREDELEVHLACTMRNDGALYNYASILKSRIRKQTKENLNAISG